METSSYLNNAGEMDKISTTLKNLWDGPTWHGPNLKDVLKGIDYQIAFRKPSAGSHNIYELVRHMTGWRQFVLENIKGNATYKLQINSEQDWPTQYEISETSWKSALDALEQSQKELLENFARLNATSLEELVAGKKFTWFVLLQGLIHHDIYHSGQISILKK